MNTAQLLGVLIAYRGIYYLLPLGVATALLGLQEVFRGKEKAYLYLRLSRHRAPAVLPNVLSFSVFISGHVRKHRGSPAWID